MISRRAFAIFVLGFFALWTLAWVKHNLLVSLGWWSVDNHAAELAYWVTAKFLVWVVYPWLFWRRRISNLRDFIGLSPETLRRGYRWGAITALIWLVLSVVMMPLGHQHFVGISVWSTYIYVAILTPIFEEIMFRGFIVSGLQALHVEGKRANVVTTVLFLLVHCLGWAFQGVLFVNLSSTVWLSIALLSLVLGFIRIHSQSLRSSILLHIANNAFAGIVG